jgi:hypothetical protein
LSDPRIDALSRYASNFNAYPDTDSDSNTHGDRDADTHTGSDTGNLSKPGRLRTW